MAGTQEYQITAPDERNTAVVGVPFEDGVGYTSDPVRLAFFKRRGWDIAPVDAYGADPDGGGDPVAIEGVPLTDDEAAAVATAEAAGITIPVLTDQGGSEAQGVAAAEQAAAAEAEGDDEADKSVEAPAPAKRPARKK